MNLLLKAKCPNIVPIPAATYPTLSREVLVKLSRALGVSSYEFRLVDPMPGELSIPNIEFFVNGNGLLGKSNWRSAVVSQMVSKGFEYDADRRIMTFEYLNHEVVLHLAENQMMLENAPLFYSYGGIGRVYALFAKRMGFVFDFKGLRIPVSFNGHPISELDCSMYHYDSINILGLLPGRYDRKYSNVQEMIQGIIGSRYFSKELFEGELDPELLASPIYALLAPKLVDPAVVNNHDYSSGKTPWINMVKKSNPGLIVAIKNTLRIHERKFQVESKLSSELISNATGPMTEENMAKFKERFKNSFGLEEDFDHYVLSSSLDNLQERIRKIFTQSPEDDKVNGEIIPTQIPWDMKNGDTFTKGGFEMTIISKRNGDPSCMVRVVKAPAYCKELEGSTRSIMLDPETMPKESSPMPRYNPY